MPPVFNGLYIRQYIIQISHKKSVLTTILAADSEIKVVGTAENGKEALEKIKLLKPDFATIDIRMPIMDGFQAIENIMAEYAIPILVISDVNDF